MNQYRRDPSPPVRIPALTRCFIRDTLTALMKALESFHPAVREWFLKQFPAPTEPQAEAWPAIKAASIR